MFNYEIVTFMILVAFFFKKKSNISMLNGYRWLMDSIIKSSLTSECIEGSVSVYENED